jgi:5'-nucleotidase/UDP-sugar diphosphatase
MKTLNSLILITTALLLMKPFVANATIVQILHTNDTHSYLDNSTHSTTKGGAARLKTLIDLYKNKMKEEGVQTITVDAGDFLEGNIYFMAENGKKSFEVHNEMGYDIGILGNHDYQMGSDDLNKILGDIDLKFSLLVANLNPAHKFKNIQEKVKPYKEIEIDGIKIAFLGLTTDEILYKWRLFSGAIISPIATAQVYEDILRNRKNDFIIALTHIGVMKDIKLAEATSKVDLIIGGHSHTALFEPTYGVNRNQKRIPIVQAGQHTEFLGRLVLDLQKGKPLKIVSYELIPVEIEASELNANIKTMVEQADQDLEVQYGKDWLNEKIGKSDLKVDDKLGTRKWAYYICDTMREKTGADIAIHSPDMNGANFPVGDITRRSILNSIPRVFELSQKFGWEIYTTKIKGSWLRLTLDALSYIGEPIVFSGIKMEYERGPFGFKIRHVTVNGKNINPFKTYTVAFTEGIVRGAEGIDPRTVTILRNPKNTGYKIWATLEDRISNKPESISNISELDHTFLIPRR